MRVKSDNSVAVPPKFVILHALAFPFALNTQKTAQSSASFAFFEPVLTVGICAGADICWSIGHGVIERIVAGLSMYVSRIKPKRLLDDETLIFSRYAPDSVSIVDGVRVRAGGQSDVIHFTCRGSVQPLSGKELRMLPEGQQIEGQLSFYVWHTDAEAMPEAGDLVKRDGIYQVATATRWGSFTICRLIRDDGQVLTNG